MQQRREHLRHDPVPAGVAQQAELELLQGREHVGKGRAVAQGTGFALHQCDVVLLIIHSMPPVDDPLMAGDHGITGHHADARRVQPGAHAISQHGGTVPGGRGTKKGLSLGNGGTTSHKTRFTPTCSPPWCACQCRALCAVAA